MINYMAAFLGSLNNLPGGAQAESMREHSKSVLGDDATEESNKLLVVADGEPEMAMNNT